MLLIGTPLVVTRWSNLSIVGDIGNAIVGASVVPLVSASSVSGVAVLRRIVLVG